MGKIVTLSCEDDILDELFSDPGIEIFKVQDLEDEYCIDEVGIPLIELREKIVEAVIKMEGKGEGVLINEISLNCDLKPCIKKQLDFLVNDDVLDKTEHKPSRGRKTNIYSIKNS